VLGRYPDRILLRISLLKFFDIRSDIFISESQNNDIWSYNTQTELFFENMIFRENIKSLPEYGYERGLGLRCRL
jgi:hypothetical protein